LSSAPSGAPPVAVIGAGGWGTALACVLARAGNAVRLWARRPEFAEHLQVRRENDAYLPGVSLPPEIRVASCHAVALENAGLVILATPTQALREVLAAIQPSVRAGALVVSASKGIEISTLTRPSELICELLGPGHPAISLSGPNFAAEVARGLPGATVLASAKREDAARARQWFAGQQPFRVYTHDDLIGVELGGALKNVIAIIAGMADGLGLGLNARAAIITRGLAEISRLGVAMGADPLTFAGLSGLGDLVLTCTGAASRNQWAGRELGQGRTIEEIVGGTRMVVEGVSTTKAAWQLAQRHGVDMPLTGELHQVLFEGKPAAEVLASILSRSLRDERESGRVVQSS